MRIASHSHKKHMLGVYQFDRPVAQIPQSHTPQGTTL